MPPRMFSTRIVPNVLPVLGGGGGHRLQGQPRAEAQEEQEHHRAGGQAARLLPAELPAERQPAEEPVEVPGLEPDGPRQEHAGHGDDQRTREGDGRGPLPVAPADVVDLGQVRGQDDGPRGQAEAQGADGGGGVEPAAGLHGEPQRPAQEQEQGEQQAVVAPTAQGTGLEPEPAAHLVVVLLQRGVEQLGREGDQHEQGGDGQGAEQQLVDRRSRPGRPGAATWPGRCGGGRRRSPRTATWPAPGAPTCGTSW